jgi:hypothetical protein
MPASERPFLTSTDRDVLSSEAVDVLRQAYDIGCPSQTDTSSVRLYAAILTGVSSFR